jgi:hypothetical protein
VGASGCPATGGDWETAGQDDIPKAATALPVKNVRLSMAAAFHKSPLKLGMSLSQNLHRL